MSTLSSLQKPRERGLQVFLLSLFAAFMIFIPFLIYDRGYFIFYGDFNVQQIPFYRMAHDAILSGNTSWSWTTDLGANFVGSYSFYLLGSPFFWITMLFPSSVVPFLMAPLLILKFSLSSVTAYWYLRRFVKPQSAVIGGLLYAFSGYSIYNIFFNHFHEAIVYFPLMLLGMEMYMKDNKRGVFALTVFASALSNYYFFIGQAIFLMIYWIIRMTSGDWKCNVGKFLWLMFEAVAGTAMAGVLLLPSYYAVVQNPRTDNQLSGWGLLIYSKSQRFYDIIHSFFFPQDIPARANFFPDSDNKWASMSAWLPVFSCSGAIAYFQSRKYNDWLRKLLIILLIMTLIPGLNALFQLFNSMYYARWFYMYVLLLVLATVKTIDEADEVSVNWKRAFGWTCGITAAITLYIGLTPQTDDKTGELSLGLYSYPDLFWITVGIAAVSLVMAILLILLYKRERTYFFRGTIGCILCIVMIFGWYSIGAGKAQSKYTADYMIDRAINGADEISLPDMNNVRIDFNNDMDNMGMFWQTPTIQAFHSIVPGSIMEFYPTIGVDRSVGSRPDTSHYALRGLLSVRYLFDYKNEDFEQGSKESSKYFAHTSSDGQIEYEMPGWSYYGEQNEFLIYENDYYIPFGFTYNYYLTRSEYNNLSQNNRELSLLKAIVLDDEDVDTYSSYLKSFMGNAYTSARFNEKGYLKDCEERRATAASSFTRDNQGFSAAISLKKQNLVFFSVPYEKGWSATVNGEPAEIVKANVGFMAVLCPAGDDISIRFDYKTPGLGTGALVTLFSTLAFALYLGGNLVYARKKKNKAQMSAFQSALEDADGSGESGNFDGDAELESGEEVPLQDISLNSADTPEASDNSSDFENPKDAGGNDSSVVRKIQPLIHPKKRKMIPKTKRMTDSGEPHPALCPAFIQGSAAFIRHLCQPDIHRRQWVIDQFLHARYGKQADSGRKLPANRKCGGFSRYHNPTFVETGGSTNQSQRH